MYFHCPREFIDQPALLVEALAKHDVPIEFDNETQTGVGAIDLEPLADEDRYETFRIALWNRRFRQNMSVDDSNGRALHVTSPLFDQLMEVFRQLGIVAVESTIEEELQFIEGAFGDEAVVKELLVDIRKHHAVVSQAVLDQEFEKAVEYSDLRDALLDQLFDVCTC